MTFRNVVKPFAVHIMHSKGFSITLRHLAWVCRMKKNGSAGTREYMSNKGFLAPSSHPSSHSFFPMNWPSGNDFPDYYSNDSLIMWLANHGLTIHLVHGCKKGEEVKNGLIPVVSALSEFPLHTGKKLFWPIQCPPTWDMRWQSPKRFSHPSFYTGLIMPRKWSYHLIIRGTDSILLCWQTKPPTQAWLCDYFNWIEIASFKSPGCWLR